MLFWYDEKASKWVFQGLISAILQPQNIYMQPTYVLGSICIAPSWSNRGFWCLVCPD